MDEFNLFPEKTALILIEYQNEWVSEQGYLRNHVVVDQEQFEDAIEHSKMILSLARKKGCSIIHVTLQPDDHYLAFGKAEYGMRHVIPKKKTWLGFQGEIHPDFVPLAHEHVITERVGASAFSGSNLDIYLRNNEVVNVVLIGFATHVCVESTLRQAHDLGYNAYVITEATGAFTIEQKQYFSRNVVQHFGKEIRVDDFA
ncbi:cysteine hydrolase [Vibrio nitrifigilis]|uniref:Cysteine hydrolase n=1 Tax=Vibrio nitrifigilis TaxID=2789781 RepID=A0ABS0GD16_9VIBR|nr:cysteine hydrolase [Vibrio nitrifigilis]MBF9000314.1 cysteine hydrolase [Vibrio nitrifigilis]